MSYFLLLIN